MNGKKIKELRTKYGITQKQLSAELNISESLLSQYETNRHEPPDDIKIKLAKYFRVSVDYLIDLTDEPVSYNPKNAIRLPDDFPEELIQSVKHFINYIKNNPLK